MSSGRQGTQTPTCRGAIDSQSVKTIEAGGPRGYRGGKKVTGRKHHVLVDTEGTLLKAKIHPGECQEFRVRAGGFA
ncbi:transposase [Skermanella rosea]|uniref:transposase n=1 Tax=Skermanella rosea TaxID=1817965 RepID=UPI00389A0DB9